MVDGDLSPAFIVAPSSLATVILRLGSLQKEGREVQQQAVMSECFESDKSLPAKAAHKTIQQESIKSIDLLIYTLKMALLIS